jgi:hypothetical protein
MDTLIDFLAEARNAYLRNDWRASYAAFVRADGLGPMPTDDLDAYSAVAWSLGHASEAVRLSERTYDRLVRTDLAIAAMKAATLALQWRARRHHAISRLWADRARALLGGASSGGTRGYLAYLDAVSALDTGDAIAVTRASTALRATAADTADSTLVVLGRVIDGLTALREFRTAEGYRLLDDALVPALDDRMPLAWAGDVYRLVLRPDSQVDAQHRQLWSESMRRWITATGVVVHIE